MFLKNVIWCLTEAKAIDIGFAARGDEDGVGVDGVGAVILAQLVGDGGAALGRFHALHGGTQREAKPLFCKDALEVL